MISLLDGGESNPSSVVHYSIAVFRILQKYCVDILNIIGDSQKHAIPFIKTSQDLRFAGYTYLL